MTLSILIPAEVEQKVTRRLAKLAKTAGTTVTLIGGMTTLVQDKRVLACHRVTVGELPRVAGWGFVAKLEHLEAGNVVSRGPAELEAELDVAWRTAKGRCEHCKTARYRRETFLLRSEAGVIVQIGRNCLADFIGVDASRLVAQAEFVSEVYGEMDEERWGGYGGYWVVAPLAYIACAVSSTELYGFVKSTEDGSTRAHVDFLSGLPPKTAENYKRWLEEQPTDAQVLRAQEICAWIQDEDVSGSSDYLWNLRLSIAERGVGKHGGLLASAPSSYNRALGIKVQAKLKGQAAADGYAVAEGEVFKGEALLIRRVDIESDFGRKAICVFRATSGHEIVWYCSGEAPTLDHSPRYQIKGRCKKHETRNGLTQTVLSRVSFKAIDVKEETKSPAVE